MKQHHFIQLFLLLQLSIFVSAQVAECPVEIDLALETANEVCLGTGRDQVCYGNNDIHITTFNDDLANEFDSPGDIAEVSHVRSMSLSAMDIEEELWGIAVMHLLANLDPSQSEDVIVLLFGDVEIENASGGQAEQIVSANTYANIRRLPRSDASVMDSVAPGDLIEVTGRLEDNSWVRVTNPETNINGWIFASLLDDVDFDSLDVADINIPYFAPMQAFYFDSGTDAVNCSSVPRDGMIVQTPEGLRRVTLWINEVTIDFLSGSGATATFQTEDDGSMSVNVLEGSAFVSSDTEGYQAVAGSTVIVKKSEDDKSVSVSRPTATHTDVINNSPVTFLNREIQLPQPASNSTIAEVNNFVDAVEPLFDIEDEAENIVVPGETSDGSNPTVDEGGNSDCPGNSCNAPGHNKDNDAADCPGNSCNAPGQNKDKDNKDKGKNNNKNQ